MDMDGSKFQRLRLMAATTLTRVGSLISIMRIIIERTRTARMASKASIIAESLPFQDFNKFTPTPAIVPLSFLTEIG
jgi:hypothetical protein